MYCCRSVRGTRISVCTRVLDMTGGSYMMFPFYDIHDIRRLAHHSFCYAHLSVKGLRYDLRLSKYNFQFRGLQKRVVNVRTG